MIQIPHIYLGRGPKVRNCRNYIQNLFFCLRFVCTIFHTGSFQVPPKKYHPHLKCQSPPKIPIWPKPLLYKCSEKWLSPPPPLYHPWGGANYVYIYLHNTVVLIIMTKHHVYLGPREHNHFFFIIIFVIIIIIIIILYSFITSFVF